MFVANVLVDIRANPVAGSGLDRDSQPPLLDAVFDLVGGERLDDVEEPEHSAGAQYWTNAGER